MWALVNPSSVSWARVPRYRLLTDLHLCKHTLFSTLSITPAISDKPVLSRDQGVKSLPGNKAV